MLRRLKPTDRFSVCALDGAVGKIEDFLLDDQRWKLRYFVVEVGGLLHRRSVLVTPASLAHVDWDAERFELNISRADVEGGPGIDAHRPVSRQHEMDFARYYGLPYYWAYAGVWGMGAHPGFLISATPSDRPPEPDESPGDVHLRSAEEVRGYHIEGTDGALGHVEDFIFDDETWEIRYLVIDTRNWWFGQKVLLAPSWADHVSWEEHRVYVNVARDVIESSPKWDGSTAALARSYEARLHEHYGRLGYWKAPDAQQHREAG